ncbi:MAG: Asp23/Gls24 family envelope stress response protein [Eubacteriaceae bacterium]|jgi:uncharacterized alkaline shock family protein YloU|nr:Asp23/Gls24 family envelope stress response protein [Eubacteriaceae bacterium]
MELESKYGTVKISRNIIAKTAALAALDCYGLVGMARKSLGFVVLLKNEHGAKGVKIAEKKDGIVINLYVIFEFGVRLQTVAENVIESVRYQVEKTTGVKVKQINVYVESVRI